MMIWKIKKLIEDENKEIVNEEKKLIYKNPFFKQEKILDSENNLKKENNNFFDQSEKLEDHNLNKLNENSFKERNNKDDSKSNDMNKFDNFISEKNNEFLNQEKNTNSEKIKNPFLNYKNQNNQKKEDEIISENKKLENPFLIKSIQKENINKKILVDDNNYHDDPFTTKNNLKKNDDLLISEKVHLYKFINQWVDYGLGFLKIIHHDKNKRILFLRDKINIKTFDVILNYDAQFNQTENKLTFYVFGENEGVYCCRFKNNEICNNFMKYINQ